MTEAVKRKYPYTDERGVLWVSECEGLAQMDNAGAFKTQVGGDHYSKMKIQPFEFSMANGLDPMQHTIIKYVTRFRDKNGKQDLEKAKHVIDLLIEYEYGGMDD